MEAISASVSTLRVSSLTPSNTRESSLFKPPLTPQAFLSRTRNPSLSLPHRLSSSSFPDKYSRFSFLPINLPSSQPALFHKTAASGYAAALLDVAQSSNSLRKVERDVRRFSRLMRSEDLRSVKEEKRGEVLKEVAERGGFEKHFVALLRLIIGKGKVGLVEEVLEEFARIYDQLSGTRVVLVSSARKMPEEQLMGIAVDVQRKSGAKTVKIRHLVDERLPNAVV
ncbi:ATP synthase delta chain, chloroplastic [Aristolochia californica]|uniref:ATP synthase delta chain, chloroplastic n=1 Tax=Aristolochia californica TaxID=171875 RepID=UPI0035DC707A